MSITGSYLSFIKVAEEFEFIEGAKALNITIPELCQVIVDCWDKAKGQLVDKRWRVDTEYRHRWYIEAVKGSKYKRGDTQAVYTADLLDFKSKFYMGFDNVRDSHMSTFMHDKHWHDHTQSTGSPSHQSINTMYHFMPLLWIELDRETHEKACADALQIVSGLPKDQYEIFWSGNKSPHIAVNAALFGFPVNLGKYLAGKGRHAYNLASKICGDVRHRNGVADTYEMTKEEIIEKMSALGITDLTKTQVLENFDPAIYGPISLIRAPYSVHEKTFRKKGVYTEEELQAGLKPAEFRYSEKKFDMDYPPIFLYESVNVQMARQTPLHKPKMRGMVDVSETDIYGFYKALFPEIVGREPNAGGWITGLDNPFYPDANPSVSVNLRTGRFYDFGNPIEYDMTFAEVFAKVNELDPAQAQARLNFLDTL